MSAALPRGLEPLSACPCEVGAGPGPSEVVAERRPFGAYQPANRWSTRVGAILFFGCVLLLAAPPRALAQEPPAEPPADWGPVSINLEDVPYPHAVSSIDFTLYGEPVRMAFMDVAPAADPNGQTAVLLHGGNYFGKAWEGTIAALREAGFRVVAIDQIGYGRSSKPIIPYSLDMHAANTKRVLDHLGIGRAAVVGHSMGGMVATRFALLYPDATSHIVLVNSIGLADTRPGRAWSEPAPALERSYASIVNTIRGHVQQWDDAYLEYVRIHYGWTLSGDWPRLATIRALNSDVMRTPIVYDWQHIAAPALVIGGAEDGPRFPELARNAADSFPNGQLVLFPGVGHNPHWEAQHLLHPALIEFLRTGRVAQSES
jgi:pimeloyl-ACP methyl ester carboxylesterase